MIIKVDQRLLDLIKKIEDKLREDSSDYPDYHFPIGWAYAEDGMYANGLGNGIEFNASIYESKNGTFQSVYVREVGKYDNDNWETHPFDSDYEEDN